MAGVSILITGQKFYNEFKNDVGFVSNLGDFTNNLTGIILENVKYIIQIDVDWFSQATLSSQFIVSGASTIITWNSNFFNDGFANGDTFVFQRIDGSGVLLSTHTGTIASMNQTTLVLTAPLSPILVDGQYSNSKIRGTTDLTASIYKFGLLGNTEGFNVESKVSGNDQGYYSGTVGLGGPRSTVFQNMIRQGTPKGWQTGSMRIRYVSNPSDYVQRFEIEHEFMNVPYYLDGELSNLQNNVIPTLFNGINTIKYSFTPGFRTVLSNPNTEKKIVVNSNNLGSVASFGENFNGFNNNYQVNSITYIEQATLNSADGLLIGTKTRVTIEVEKIVGTFSAGERAGIYVSYLPSQTEYQNTVLTDLKENFLYDNVLGNAGLAGVAGQDFITNFTVFSPVGNVMTMFFDVEYSLAQKLRLANLNSQQPIFFLIGVELGDVTLPSASSDRVTILADVEEYDESADIPDLMEFDKFDIYPHNQQIGVGSGFTDMTSWNEDGLVIDYNFKLDLNKQAVMNSFAAMLVAYDPITKIFFEMDRYTFNIFPTVISSGVQQLILATTRGYILLTGDQFDDVTMNVGSQAAGIQNYNGRIAQKISWQEWIQNLDVDPVFFDSSEPNNNLNDKTSNYSMLNGYEIRLAILSNLSGVNALNVSGLTDYLFLSSALTIYDYEKDGNPTPIWTHLIETFDASGSTNLGGSILTGQDTLFRATWTNSGGPVTSLVNLWGINRIEETDQPGYAMTEMSSLNLPLPTGQQILKPTGVLTLLDMTIVAGQVVMECLIDGNIVTAGKNYNLSTRIQDDNFIVGGKQKSPSGDFKQKGGSTDVKLIAP